MPWTSDHIPWLANTGVVTHSSDGKPIELWEFQHQPTEAVLSAWARHFRNHYCLDTQIDLLRNGTGLSRKDYLNSIKFPDQAGGNPLGPATRAGDFGEILIADYLEYILCFWVPRTIRYRDKNTRNESEKGCDIIGFKLLGEGESPNDILAIYESKTQFSGNSANPRLQNAVDDSGKDIIRKAESLNAIKQRLIDQDKIDDAKKVERFQNPTDKPHKQVWGAAALFSSNVFDPSSISNTSTADHPDIGNLKLIVIRGENMMPLVHELYRRAADEA